MSTLDTLLDKELNNGYTVLTIDEPSRTIQYDGKELILGVEDDKYAERIYFVCPKFVGDEIDVSLKTNRVDVKFENGFGDTYFTQCADVELQDDGNVKFSWLITEKVAVTYGNVKFSVCIKEMNAESVVVKEWHTAPCVGKVMTGVDVGIEDLEVITDTTYPTIQLVEQVREYEHEVNQLNAYVEESVGALQTMVGDYYSDIESNRRAIEDMGHVVNLLDESKADKETVENLAAKPFQVLTRVTNMDPMEYGELGYCIASYNELMIIVRVESTSAIDIGIANNTSGASGFVCKRNVTGTTYTQFMMNKVVDNTGDEPVTYVSWNTQGSTAWEISKVDDPRYFRWYSSTNDLSPLVTVVVCGR